MSVIRRKFTQHFDSVVSPNYVMANDKYEIMVDVQVHHQLTPLQCYMFATQMNIIYLLFTF